MTQLFYYTNWYHDYAYGLGFTETARNFQNDNFGNGGTGGDARRGGVRRQLHRRAVRRRAATRSSASTTPTSTPTAPTAPSRGCRCTSATPTPAAWPGVTQRANNRDTIIHEYTHGICGRIISNSNLAGGIQSSALGEGWSDALATSINNDPVYGEYNNGNYTNGIRGVAYDDDSLEYGDFAGTSEHDNGRDLGR